MQLLQSLFLLSAALLAATTTTVEAGGYKTVSVEPYLMQWCADQYPNQIGTKFTGYDIASHMKYRDYLRIEPYLGDYCFDQFPELSDSYDRANKVSNLKWKNHKQIEPFFLEWGEVQMRRPSVSQRINLEPYIHKWCVDSQFPHIIKDHDQKLLDAKRNKVTMEPTFGKWCFDQFPTEMAGLDKETEIAKLKNSHIPLENNLVAWIASVEGSERASRHHLNQEDAALGGLIGFLIALAVLVPIFTCVWCYCKRRQAAQDAQFQQDVAHAEAQINKEMDSMPDGVTGNAPFSA